MRWIVNFELSIHRIVARFLTLKIAQCNARGAHALVEDRQLRCPHIALCAADFAPPRSGLRRVQTGNIPQFKGQGGLSAVRNVRRHPTAAVSLAN
jgi:hypothetical protein